MHKKKVISNYTDFKINRNILFSLKRNFGPKPKPKPQPKPKPMLMLQIYNFRSLK